MKRSILHLPIILGLILTAIPAYGKILNIYVSIPPQRWLVEVIAGNLAATEMLLGKGQDPHTFEPTPRQIAGLSKAELYFTIGMTFEDQLSAKLAQTSSNLNIVDTSLGIDRSAHQEHLHASSPEAPSSAHNDLDPHIWLSPLNLIKIARTMAAAIGKIDPGNQAVYKRNVQTLEERLLALHEKIKVKLAPYDGALFFVFHPAFGYFAEAYHLHQVPVEIEGKSPSPRQLGKIVSRARSQNIHVLFVQPQFDPRSAQAVAQAIDGKIVILDPLVENMIDNLETMADTIEEVLKNR